MEGFDFVVIAMGLFGLSEILISAEQTLKAEKPPKVKGLLPSRGEWKPSLKSIGRGTGLGFLIGLIPGTNSVIPPILSYSMEKRIAKDPSRFGKGAIEGVAGPETANNSFCGGALIPLFTLGILALLRLPSFLAHSLCTDSLRVPHYLKIILILSGGNCQYVYRELAITDYEFAAGWRMGKNYIGPV